ncbi:MAG: hypothetical protein AB1540_08590, partial [Bdellovibrionota bacterium]
IGSSLFVVGKTWKAFRHKRSLGLSIQTRQGSPQLPRGSCSAGAIRRIFWIKQAKLARGAVILPKSLSRKYNKSLSCKYNSEGVA